MKIVVTENYEEMSCVAAEQIAKVVAEKQNSVLGLATGSTPLGVYDILAQFCREKKLSFKSVRTVNLDEYVGLGREDEQSYISFMFRNLFDKIDLPAENANIPNGLAKNMQQECDRYHKLLQNCRQDIQILGLGSNGHIGFNEPDTPFSSVTHVVQLAQSTLKDNSRFFDKPSAVPTQAITMGISEIMSASKILLLASGENKQQAVYRMICGEVSESCPASVLQSHPDCTVILDKAAAGLLPLQYQNR